MNVETKASLITSAIVVAALFLGYSLWARPAYKEAYEACMKAKNDHFFCRLYAHNTLGAP